MNSRSSEFKLFHLVIFIVQISMLLGACQLQPAQVSSSNNSQQTSTPLPATPIPPTATPTLVPSPTPTSVPLTLWLDPFLPADFLEKITLPEGIITTSTKTEANLFLTAGDPQKNNTLLGETWQSYALVAPFFTVHDDLALADLRSLARGYQPEDFPLRRYCCATRTTLSFCICSICPPARCPQKAR